MGLTALGWAWRQKLDPQAKLVLLAIADREMVDGKCWVPDLESAIDMAGVNDVETWDAYIPLLQKLGFIVREGRDRHPAGDPGTSCRYYILSQ